MGCWWWCWFAVVCLLWHPLSVLTSPSRGIVSLLSVGFFPFMAAEEVIPHLAYRCLLHPIFYFRWRYPQSHWDCLLASLGLLRPAFPDVISSRSLSLRYRLFEIWFFYGFLFRGQPVCDDYAVFESSFQALFMEVSCRILKPWPLIW